MSEIKRAGDAVKDIKRLKARFGAVAEKAATATALADASATKAEAAVSALETESKEFDALLTELGSNFGPVEPEVAPAKPKGLFGK
jgi:hypothetical protein